MIKSSAKLFIDAPAKKYPYLGYYNNFGNEFIVFFYQEGCGTVINNRKGEEAIAHKVGEYSSNWCETEFKPYFGEVTISNR